MALTFGVWVDTDDDYVVTDLDITAYVTKFTLDVGFSRFDVRVQDVNTLELELRDVASLLPWDADRELTPGRLLALKYTASAVTVAKFVGPIVQVEPDTLRSTLRVVCAGRLTTVRGPVTLPVMTDVRADQVVAEVLARVREHYPLESSARNADYWLVGRGRLGTSTVLAGTERDVSLEAGKTTFAYVGDVYREVDAQRVLAEVVTAEWGLLYDDGSTIRFRNRHYQLPVLGASAPAVTGISAYGFSDGGGFNTVRARLAPVTLTVGATLYTLGAALGFGPGVHERRVRFRDEFGEARGLLGALSSNLALWTAASGGSLATSAELNVYPDASGARLVVDNRSTERVYLQAGQALTGTAIDHDPEQRIEARNEYDLARRGPVVLDVALPGLGTEEWAESLVAWLVSYFGGAGSVLEWIEVTAGAVVADEVDLRDWTLQTLVEVVTPFHTGRYRVRRMTQRWVRGVLVARYWLDAGRLHEVWQLNRSKLGSETYLAL